METISGERPLRRARSVPGGDRAVKVPYLRENRVPDREPYRSLQHLVWHITAILQSMDIMEGKSECQNLEDLIGRLVQVSILIESDLQTGPLRASEGKG
jgi:hypothetical protein